MYSHIANYWRQYVATKVEEENDKTENKEDNMVHSFSLVSMETNYIKIISWAEQGHTRAQLLAFPFFLLSFSPFSYLFSFFFLFSFFPTISYYFLQSYKQGKDRLPVGVVGVVV